MIVISLLLTAILTYLIKKIIILPIDEYDKINNRLVSRYDTIIFKGLEEMNKFMKFRYTLFSVLCLIIFIFSLIYVAIFCTMYSYASLSWLFSGIFSLIIFYLIQILFTILQSLIRSIVFSLKFRKKRVAEIVYYTSYYIF